MGRKVQFLKTESYNQNIKNGYLNKVVLTNYSQLILKSTFERPERNKLKIKAWAKFNNETFNGIQLIAGLYYQNQLKRCGSCTFKVYLISDSDSWVETLIYTGNGLELSDYKYKLIISQSNLSPFEVNGYKSLKIEVTFTRYNKTFKDLFYVNHLGLSDEVMFLRNQITLIELSKLDE